MLVILAVFIISFIQSGLATKETHAIAHSQSVTAAIWAVVRSGVSFTFLMVIIQIDKWPLIIPYMAGDGLATYIALRKYDHVKKHVDN
jgi:hypothetical protein